MEQKLLNERIQELREKKQFLNDNDAKFATDLVRYYEARSFLSEKQITWVNRLLARADGNATREDTKVESIFDGSKLRGLFDKATETLKYPAINYKNEKVQGGNIHIYRAGSNSKTPGWLLITNGAKYPSGIVFGSIDLKGHGKFRKDIRPEVKTIVLKVASDPVGTAKVTGIKYSNCCFCKLELTNPISLHHGYGPICAEKWGLPWQGEVSQEEKEKERKEITLIDLGQEIDNAG